MKTILQFDLIKFGEKEYMVDFRSLYVFGFINLFLLEDLLTDNDSLCDMSGVMRVTELKTITIKVWQDSDDDKEWLDYEVLPDDYEVQLP